MDTSEEEQRQNPKPLERVGIRKGGTNPPPAVPRPTNPPGASRPQPSPDERPHIWVVEILEDDEWVTTDNAGTSRSCAQTQAGEWRACGAEDARVRRYVREED